MKRYVETLKNRPGTSTVKDASEAVKALATAKFDETVELALSLGIDTKKTDQLVRGTVTLPNGTGKAVRICVITPDADKTKEAEEAGADHVGFTELLEKIQGGWLGFDVMLTTPTAMPQVGKLGKTLGPRGLMPSPKTGTVTDEIGAAVAEYKRGRVEFRNDRSGNVHVPVGKASFAASALEENVMAVLEEVAKARPKKLKASYVKSCYLSPTMGPSVEVDLSDVQEKLKERGVTL